MVDPRKFDTDHRMGWGSRFLIGAFACAALAMVLVIGFSFAFSRFLDRTVENYTDLEPNLPSLPAVTQTEIDTIEERVENYEQEFDKGFIAQPLVLTEREVNVLLAEAVKNDGDGTAIQVELLPGQVQAELSLPLTQTLPLGPWSRDLTGRYLNGTALFDAAVRDGKVDLRLASFEVKGRRLPERVLTVLRDEIENSGILDEPDVRDFLDKVDSVQIGAGELTIIPPH